MEAYDRNFGANFGGRQKMSGSKASVRREIETESIHRAIDAIVVEIVNQDGGKRRRNQPVPLERLAEIVDETQAWADEKKRAASVQLEHQLQTSTFTTLVRSNVRS